VGAAAQPWARLVLKRAGWCILDVLPWVFSSGRGRQRHGPLHDSKHGITQDQQEQG
jgi:hypothetical protein